ncbi:lamin tail domain-containing protein, partial [Xanthovirga aplysinae]|uniref:lamin tail domain-containing protein n=1 Tax=Xanthovirga aplysinae TaxID=2529853 RepID=UPI00165737AD
MPYEQGFEDTLTTGTNVTFLPFWNGNEVQASSRIHQSDKARSGNFALGIIPTSSFQAEITITLDLANYSGAILEFYAYSEKNGTTDSNRPALLSFATSLDGGQNFNYQQQIGDNNSFPNDNSTTYSPYHYQLPSEAGNQANVQVLIRVERGEGSGSTALLLIDDFQISPKEPVFGVDSVLVKDAKQVEVFFNQKLDVPSSEDISNYWINNEIGNPEEAILETETPNKVTLLLGPSLANNNYELQIKGIYNQQKDEKIDSLSLSFPYVTPTEWQAIVINEIFADPTGDYPPDSTVLPTGTSDEFVELFNASNQAINLEDFQLSGGNIPSYNLAPGKYVILCSTSKTELFEPFGEVVGVFSWNTLQNAGELITLTDNTGHFIDSVHYEITWYSNEEKANGGWSLEQINPFLPCEKPENWQASISKTGATPGAINSIYEDSGDAIPPLADSLFFKSSTELTLEFNEPMDKNSLMNGHYLLDPTIIIKETTTTHPFTAVQLSLQNSLEENQRYELEIKDLKDCSGNLLNDTTLSFIYDENPPVVEKITPLNQNIIRILFSEKINGSTTLNEENYTLTPDKILDEIFFSPDAPNQIEISFKHYFTENENYLLSVKEIEDVFQNKIDSTAISFSFYNEVDTAIVSSANLLTLYLKTTPSDSSALQTKNYIMDEKEFPQTVFRD